MKKKFIVLKVFIILILLATTVFAGTDGINIKVDKNEIRPGDEFIITLSLKDLANLNSGVNSLQGYLNIDENIIEDITFDRIIKNSDNQVTIGNETLTVYDVQSLVEDQMPEYGVFFNNNPISGNGDYRIVIDLRNNVSTSDLLQIKCKVKPGIADGIYSNVIECEEFEVTSGGTSKYNDLTGTVSLNIKSVGAVNNVVNNTTNNRVNNNSNRIVNNSVNRVVNRTVNNAVNRASNNPSNRVVNVNNAPQTRNNAVQGDATMAKSNLPAAGSALDIILKVVFSLSIVGLVIYSRYKKYKNV